MSTRRAALVTAGITAGAVAGGFVGRAVLSRHPTPDPDAFEDLAALPPDDLGPIRSLDGTELSVRAAGDPSDPVIVFAHGFSLDMTSWHFQWTALSDRYRCVLLDFRSHGRSARAAGGNVSARALAGDLTAVLDAVATDGRAMLVAHSMGGMAALAAAETRPDLFAERLGGVVFSGTAPSDLLRGAMGSITQMLRPRLGSLREAARRVNRLRRYVVAGPADISHLVTRMTQFGPHASARVVDYVVGLAARAPTEVWTDGLAGLMDVDLRDALPHVRAPALVLAGELDRVTPTASAISFAAALPEGRLEVIPQAGHIPMLERHDEFNLRVRAFAEEVLERPATRPPASKERAARRKRT